MRALRKGADNYMRRLLKETGQSFVEFTIILPVAAILIFGVVDLGKAISYWLDSSHLANETARYAVVDRCPSPCTPSDATGLPAAIKAQAETAELKNATSVCIQDRTAMASGSPPWTSGHQLEVTVSSPYDFLHILNLASRTVTGKSTMRIEKDWSSPPLANQIGIGPDYPGNCPGP
jgi:Flp pilus assembly protein TadG